MKTTFDYIIVGAGSSGCALAARLSEHDGLSVALVEAGGPAPDRARVPLAAPELFGTACDWARQTTPQPGLGGRTVTWPSGRMVGGSSTMNFMMWIPGSGHDYEEWAIAAGDLWSWPEVEPFLRAAEGWTGTKPRPPLATSGPLLISPPSDPDPSTEAFLEACRETGMRPGNVGLGSLDTAGFGMTPLNQSSGARWSAADGYLAPASEHLTLVTGAEVKRVALEGNPPKAVGVELNDGRMLQARREVVLCAGTVGSARLLLRSGIGAPATLRSADIATQVPLPGVGQNLHDHLILDLVVPASGTTRFSALASTKGEADAARLFAKGTGPLTSNIAEAVTFLRSDATAGPPDLELIWSPAAFGPNGFEPAYTIGVVLLRPRSHGGLSLSEIDPAYLSDDADVDILVAGIDAAERLLETPSLKRLTASEREPPWGHSDSSRADFARAHADTVFHPIGTCRIGYREDPNSVVDPHLRVHGTRSLRVADTSIIPTPPRAHTHALAVMIGERAARLICERPPAA